MLAALQIPLTDVRPFLEVDTGRLDKPSWPLAKVGSDFVRSFGTVERRLRGVAAQSIQDRFKKVSESSANDELKNQLIKLNEAVGEMLKSTFASAARSRLASDLKVLTDEAISEAPRRKWYELSA